MDDRGVPERLDQVLAGQPTGYLLSVGRTGRAHVGVIAVRLSGDRMLVSRVGATTQADVAFDRRVTVVVPPAEPSGYSLIVDGYAVSCGAEFAIEPSRAVLHRPAEPGSAELEPAATAGKCAEDCVELSTHPGT